MGLFGGSQPADASLINLLVDPGPDSYAKKKAMKTLAATELTIQAIARDEPLVLLAYNNTQIAGYNSMLVVTDQTVMEVTKKGIEKRFVYSEIAQTRLLTGPGTIVVEVGTHKAAQDFMPDDQRRYSHMIVVRLDTPGAANNVCAAIDARI
jgi:hypothetical protein